MNEQEKALRKEVTEEDREVRAGRSMQPPRT